MFASSLVMETKRSPGSNIERTGISEFFHAKHTWGQTSVCFVLDDADVLLYLGKTKSLNLVANSLTSSLTRRNTCQYFKTYLIPPYASTEFSLTGFHECVLLFGCPPRCTGAQCT